MKLDISRSLSAQQENGGKMENMNLSIVIGLVWLAFGGLAKYGYWHSFVSEHHHSAGPAHKLRTFLTKKLSHRSRRHLVNLILVGGGFLSLIWLSIRDIGPQRETRSRHKVK
jgi:hypothetical protein